MTEIARLLLDHTDPLGAAILLGTDNPLTLAGGVSAPLGSLYTSRLTGMLLRKRDASATSWTGLDSHINVADFGAKGDGTTNDTAVIQDALTNAAGGVVLIPPTAGGFLTTGLTLGTAKGLRIMGKLKTATNSPVVSFTADDQFVDGGGSIEGTGGAGSSQIGVDINGFLNFDVSRLRIYNVVEGVRVQNTSGAYKGGRVSLVSAFGCTTGFHCDAIGEYVALIGCDGIGCTSGFAIRGGNAQLVACNGNDNTNGIVLEAGSNDSHGAATGCNFNHNTSYALLTAAIVNGFDFIGCHMYGGEVYLNGAQDVAFVGGIYSIVNWRLAAAARGRVSGATILTANGDGLIASTDSLITFDDQCARAGGVRLPLSRTINGGYVIAAPPAAGQTIANAATTTVLWTPTSQQAGAVPATTAYTFLVGATGVLTNKGLGGGKVDLRMMMKLTGVGATPTQLYANIRKNGSILHPFITAATMVAAGTTYSIFNWNGRIQADVGDTLTVEIVNNTGAAMTLAFADSLLIAEGL